MRYITLFVLAVSTLGAFPVTAQAQDKKVSFSLGGGFTTPNSEVKDHLGSGYNINFGVEVKATPAIGIEGLYSFNGLGDKRYLRSGQRVAWRGNRSHRLLRGHEHAVWNGQPGFSEAGRFGHSVRARRDGRFTTGPSK